MNLCHSAEKEAIGRHRVVNARRGQHALAEKSESGDGDADGDQARAAFSQYGTHDGGRGCRCRGQAVGAEHANADDIDDDVNGDDTDDSQEQSNDEVALRTLQLSGNEARCLPSRIGKEHWRHRSAECGEQSASHRTIEAA